MRAEAFRELHREGLTIEEQGPTWALPYVHIPRTEEGEQCIYTDEQIDFTYDVATTLVSSALRVMSEEGGAEGSSTSEDEAVEEPEAQEGATIW